MRNYLQIASSEGNKIQHIFFKVKPLKFIENYNPICS